MLGCMPKNDDAARNEKMEADRALEAWDGEGGRRAPRRDEGNAGESPARHAPRLSRRVADRRRGDRRR